MRALAVTVAVLLFAARTPADPTDPYRAFIVRSSIAPSGAGVLDGWTIAVKDNIDVAGLRTTAGARLLATRAPAQRDATSVARLRAAGATVVGKTNMDTWARGERGVSEVRGATANSIDPTLGPGGSSAGSAVAVATGQARGALGSDTCGSLRYPATYNNVYGLRPTAGRVSSDGLVPLSFTQDVVGPIARTPADIATLLDVIAGADPLDPRAVNAPSAAVGAVITAPQTLSGVRIGVFRSLGRVDPVAAELVALGAELIDVPVPSAGAVSLVDIEFGAARRAYLAWDGVGVMPWLGAPLAAVSGSRVWSDTRRRQQQLRSALVALLDSKQLDALAYATTPFPPAKRGAPQPSTNCHLAATSGLPALAVPGGITASKRRQPIVGIDLLGRPYDEPRLLAIAESLARARAARSSTGSLAAPGPTS